MKPHLPVPSVNSAPGETAIRDYAYHLYEQSGHVPGRDLENWLEASACLHAHPGAPESASFAPVAQPKFGPPEQGHVHAATGHGRTVEESTAHTSSHRHA